MLIHYSTDYVFDGVASSPYATDHPIDPINAYGRSKALGESLVESSGCQHLIIRTSWLYAPWNSNFVMTMIRLLREKESIRVVDDQRGRPTSAQQLAETSLKLIEHDAAGIYHATDGGECTWFEFACEIARLIGSDCKIDRCTSDEFPRPAKRPAYSVLDLATTERAIGEMSNWASCVASVVDHIQR